MSAGHTEATKDVGAQYSSGRVDIKNVLHRSHDAYKVLFFNQDQYSLLAAEKLARAVFMCDFGTGNTLKHDYLILQCSTHPLYIE